MGSETICIDAEVLDFAWETGGIANIKRLESVTGLIESSNNAVHLTLDCIDACLEALLAGMMLLSLYLEIDPLGFGEMFDITTEVLVGCIKGVRFIDGNVLGPVNLPELPGYLSVCE